MKKDWALNLARSSVDLICLCRDGKVAFLNDAGKGMLGIKRGTKFIGIPFTEFAHPGDTTIARKLLTGKVPEGKPLALRLNPRHRDEIKVKAFNLSFGGGKGEVVIQALDKSGPEPAGEIDFDPVKRLQNVINTVADGIFVFDDKGRISSFNPSAERIFGYSADDVVGKSLRILHPRPSRGRGKGLIREYLENGRRGSGGLLRGEDTGRRKDGTRFPMKITVSELGRKKQKLFTAVVQDISERTKLEEEIRDARDKLEESVEERTRKLTREAAERRRAEGNLRLAAKVIETTNEAVLIADAQFRVTSVNPAFTEITGYKADEVIGRKPTFHKVLRKDKTLFAKMQEDMQKQGHWEGEFWNKRKNGDDYAQRLSISAITDETGKVSQYAALIGDITKRKQDEERIRYQANYDSLTKLPNRTLFLDRLNLALARMKRGQDKLGLMFIDLDGFKLVNDTLGHEIGDLLLQEAAKRLSQCVRRGDTIARLGGDEFTVIMPDLEDPRNGSMVAQRILDLLAKPYVLDGHEAFVSASIGITVFPDDGDTASHLLRNADAAMYRAKEQGKANYQFFTVDLNEEVKERVILKNSLIKARQGSEFSLHYQPKLEIQSGHVTSVEALMRWNNPELGTISPDKFIPIMEESGLAMEMGEWVIRTACTQFQKWRDEGAAPLRVAVNLSSRQLREANFISVVERVLKETGVDPVSLEIEITENMLMSDSTNIVVALDTLHDMGIHISMDDFGTGYSSLNHLRRFPIDTIKIDGTFTADIESKPEEIEIIKAIITMGHSLNRRVAAEGVETEGQLSILKEHGCDEIQGYFLCPPKPADELSSFLQIFVAEYKAKSGKRRGRAAPRGKKARRKKA
ncbi:MAG: EAL domain-containing protein [Rhodospirillales bacterium]|nr:EAL domain-containing protein [Rhodospirillales bacterium]